MARGRGTATVERVRENMAKARGRVAAAPARTNESGVPRYDEESVRRVWKLIKDNRIEVVDLKFNDLPGLWQHFSIPVAELGESAKEAVWVDGIGVFGGPPRRGAGKKKKRR